MSDRNVSRPNVMIILNDDMGFSDIGCFGGEVDTPNLNRLAANGLRYSQFYNTARCSPSRASLLTGLHPHQTGIGILTYSSGPEGYAGDLNRRCVTIAEVLKQSGYKTYMSGKWHVTNSATEPSHSWPLQRGFDEFFGTIMGAGSFYNPNTLTRGNDNVDHEAERDQNFFYTDAISDHAAGCIRAHREQNSHQPFFQYVAYTAPHWPLHAHEEDIAKYRGRFDAGWDRLREERMSRLVREGIIHPSSRLTDRDPTQPPWPEAADREWLLRCMEVYAAQIDRMDQGIGRILKALEETGQLDNTLLLFLSDNGGSAEDIPMGISARELVEELMIAKATTRAGEPVRFGNDPNLMPGGEDTYQSYGTAWANLSNAPFRLYKHWVHEGGIATPLVVHWPAGIESRGEIRHNPGQLPDIMATIVEATGATYPRRYGNNDIPPCEGESLVASFRTDESERGPLFWEHEGNAAVRMGKWKLVRKYPGEWELYDMGIDRTEMQDLAPQYPDRVCEMRMSYEAWAERCGVIPREKILEMMKAEGATAFWEEEEEKEEDGALVL